MAQARSGADPQSRSGAETRLGRALIGWMDTSNAIRALLGQRADVPPTDEIRRRVKAAQEVVSRRPTRVVQPDTVVRELPANLAAYVQQLQTRPAAQPYFQEGWTVNLVDLRQVYAFQPQIVIEGLDERLAAIKSGDIESIARVTVPAETERVVLTPSIDANRNIWNLSSDNPNLRVVGHFAGAPEGSPPGAAGLGFLVALLPSFMQVAQLNDRWFLRDGYHRAVGLLRLGISIVPALTRTLQGVEQLLPPGTLPLSALLGPRPPLVSDYLDDSVAAEVRVPTSRKAILIQAIEVGLMPG